MHIFCCYCCVALLFSLLFLLIALISEAQVHGVTVTSEAAFLRSGFKPVWKFPPRVLLSFCLVVYGVYLCYQACCNVDATQITGVPV